MQHRINHSKPTLLTIFFLVNLYGYSCLAQQIPQSPANQLILPAKNYELKFRWQGDTIHSAWEPYTALLIPVKLLHCREQFYMQFDLGSPYSMFYRNKLEAIQARYPRSVQVRDSMAVLTGFGFKLGDQPVMAERMAIKQFDSSGINWQANSIEIIGTIGVDLIEDKTLVIDYPGEKLLIRNDIPAAMASSLSLVDFIFAGKSILLPAIIRKKRTILYFDTGSSTYELLTDKETSFSLSAPNATSFQYPVKSWEKIWIANTLSTNDSIEIAGKKILIGFVTYMDGVSDSQIAQMMKMGIGGMTGNKLFLNFILVLDTKNKKFGMISSR